MDLYIFADAICVHEHNDRVSVSVQIGSKFAMQYVCMSIMTVDSLVYCLSSHTDAICVHEHNDSSVKSSRMLISAHDAICVHEHNDSDKSL